MRVSLVAQQVVRADAENSCAFTWPQVRRGSTPALGVKAQMNKSREPERHLRDLHVHQGAWSMSVLASMVVCSVPLRLRSALESTLNVESVLGLDRVASIGAQLRSSLVDPEGYLSGRHLRPGAGRLGLHARGCLRGPVAASFSG